MIIKYYVLYAITYVFNLLLFLGTKYQFILNYLTLLFIYKKIYLCILFYGHSMYDLSSLPRVRTQASCIESAVS